MAVKYTIEETLGLDEPYEPSPEVMKDIETMRNKWEGGMRMSNCYLCDTCQNRRDSITGEICAFRLESVGKIVHADGEKPDELCMHYVKEAS